MDHLERRATRQPPRQPAVAAEPSTQRTVRSVIGIFQFPARRDDAAMSKVEEYDASSPNQQLNWLT
jgi:hypothetical protein